MEHRSFPGMPTSAQDRRPHPRRELTYIVNLPPYITMPTRISLTSPLPQLPSNWRHWAFLPSKDMAICLLVTKHDLFANIMKSLGALGTGVTSRNGSARTTLRKLAAFREI